MLSAAHGGLQGGWIVDPAFDNHDLSVYLCNATHSSCPILRACEYDPVLSADAAINGTCGELGCYACLHKQLWPPAPNDYLTGGLLVVCGVLAGASGIGGGGLNVPLLMLAGSFLVEEAVVLSHVAVFGNAIAQNWINARRSHPHSPGRPLMDFDIPLLLLPAQLGGNALGVLVGPSLPATGVELLACCLLLFASVKTFLTARKAFKRETEEARNSAALAYGTAPPTLNSTKQLRDPLVAPSAISSTSAAVAQDVAGEVARPEAADAAAAAAVDLEALQTAAFPSCTVAMKKLTALAVLWSSLVLLFLGSNYYSKGKGKCAPASLAFIFAQLAAVLVAACAAAVWLMRDQRRNTALALPGDMHWSASSAVGLPCMGAVIGAVAGLLGLGGGELMAPLLLVVGMLPQVASATSALMVLFTSSSNVVHYVIKGVLSPDPGYVSAALIIGFSSALCGRLLALRLVRKLSHPSIIAFVLGGVLLVALALLIVNMTRDKVEWSFSSICK